MTDDVAPPPAGDTNDPASPAAEPLPAISPPKIHLRLWLKWGAVGVAALAFAALIGGYFLPREPEITRTIDVAVSRAALFPLLADLRHLPEWSPDFAGPDVLITFTGPLDGVGQTMAWDSKRPEIGSGVQTITVIDADSAVDMSVARAGQSPTVAWFRLTEKGANQTTVVWGYRKDLGFNPINRYGGLSIDSTVGPVYERGLKRLKAFAEAPKDPAPPKAD
jgi:hypothetical protein